MIQEVRGGETHRVQLSLEDDERDEANQDRHRQQAGICQDLPCQITCSLKINK